MQIDNGEDQIVIEADIELEKESLFDSARFRALLAVIIFELLLYGLVLLGVNDLTPEQVALVQELANLIALLVGGWIIGRSIRNTAV